MAKPPTAAPPDDIQLVTDERPWKLLKEPFPEDQLELKPQPLSRQDQDKGRCEQGTKYTADGLVCGGWHSRSIHLTYVGHAGITDRLNEVCGPEEWTLEPLAVGADGLPVIRGGQLWVKLTIWGVTKIEVGDADGRSGYEEGKVIWSDSLKRAAMRFGIGTYLWSKSDKAKALIERTDSEPVQQAQRTQQRPAGGEDPWEVYPIRPKGKAAIDAALRADELSVLASLWHEIVVDGRAHGPQTVTNRELTREELSVLNIQGPMEIADVMRRIKTHLEQEGISVRDHIAADHAFIDGPDTGQSVPEGDGDVTA
jgi:hypothetical protein